LGRILANKLNYNFIDFDEYIEDKEDKTVAQIFTEKGEIYFRKLESAYLKEILDIKNSVISLGGGTPCYANNMDLINDSDGTGVYINVPVGELTSRLWKERLHRPLLKHQDTEEKLEEFIRKHLFERSFYYNQADIKIAAGDKSELKLVEEILSRLL
ncbi:MAG: shikimate kinase, partial [Leeuwenhoekiella sp.]